MRHNQRYEAGRPTKKKKEDLSLMKIDSYLLAAKSELVRASDLPSPGKFKTITYKDEVRHRGCISRDQGRKHSDNAIRNVYHKTTDHLTLETKYKPKRTEKLEE